MLRHFSRASNLFSKLYFTDISESREKQALRHTHFRGQLMPKPFVGCGLFFPNHIASVFDLFSSNPEQLLKASNSQKVLQLNLCLARNRRCRLHIVKAYTPFPLVNIYTHYRGLVISY